MESNWVHIAHAPKDGTRLLMYAPGSQSRGEEPIDRTPVMRVDRWHKNSWWQMRPRNPYTHWMPLPEAPDNEK